MILKYYETNKINLKKYNIVLFHGKNEGAKHDEIKKILSQDKEKTIIKYEEKEILDNENNFYETVLSGSLFENNKIVIINRASNKILKIIEYLDEKNLKDIIIVIDAENLDKKSKLRSLIEKSKKYIAVAFYPDTQDTLSKITFEYAKKNNLGISMENINLIVSQCNGDRGVLKNELNKIKMFMVNKKKISTEEIIKLTNLIEDHGISELVDNCLAKNEKKTLSILNENNISAEECMIIIRTFLLKTKRLFNLAADFENNNNLEKTILNSRPPIFWKDKEIIKKQVSNWKKNQINQLIIEINDVELKIKQNYENAIRITSNFILEKLNSN